MIKRTLYFGNEAYLSTEDEQLVVSYPDDKKPETKAPIEDIGMVILDHYRVVISHTLLSKLLDQNAAVVTCDEKHMPQGLLLNLQANHTQHEHFQIQIQISEAQKKRIWQKTIQQKIINQASLLKKESIPTDNMRYWAGKVKPGDIGNHEARAAAYYWDKLFKKHLSNFKRGRFQPFPNDMLNYGYAILRALTARSLVGSGLLPTLGIHHRNKYNAYCLADDIMEPYRPFVDAVVLGLVEEGYTTLDTEVKKELLQIPAQDVCYKDRKEVLMNMMQLTTASLYECMKNKKGTIKYPSFYGD